MPGTLDVMGISLPLFDGIALLFFISVWGGYALFANHQIRAQRDSVLTLMFQHRRRWMHQMLKRENRLADINSVGNLMRSISFFASTTVLIIVGLVSMMGKHEVVQNVIATVPFATKTPAFVWELKLLVLAVVFIYAFFKYTWSLRQYNYVSVLISAAPLHNESVHKHEEYATKAAILTGNAARHFSYGLRAYYFAMAGLAWFLHAYLFILATVLIVFIIYRREYRSKTLDALNIQLG